MKKAILTGAAALITIFHLQAQDAVPMSEEYAKIRMGLSVSPVISWFSPDGDPNLVSGNGVRFMFNYGLHTDFRLGGNPNYYFSTGIFLIHTGGVLNHNYAQRLDPQSPLQLSSRESLFRINYVNIPVTFLLRTNEIGYMRYFARAGFDLGVNVKANADVKDIIGNTTLSQDKEDISEFVNLFRTALHIELGFEYNLSGNTNIAFSLEWNNGLNNVFSKKYKLPESFEGDVALIGPRIKSITNFLALNATLYF